MSDRPMATLRTVSNKYPIPDKDRIELIQVDGWQVISKKDEFEIGDMCVYAEPDSILPEKPEFEFLRSKKFRIKTMKMAGVVSQGIVFPLSVLPSRTKKYILGEDVTELLEIKKYESETDFVQEPESNFLKNKFVKKLLRYKVFRDILLPKKEFKGFPKFINKTDEENIQNLTYLFSDKFKDVSFVVREKLEGQSGTWFLQRKKNWFGKTVFEFGVCSRNVRKFKQDNSSYWKVAIKYNIENVLKKLIGDEEWIAIQGECVGPGIQGNIYKLNEIDVYLFNYLTSSGRIEDYSGERVFHHFGMKWCPLFNGNYILPNHSSQVLDYSNGKSILYDTDREGLVFRNNDLGISFKARSPKYLLHSDT